MTAVAAHGAKAPPPAKPLGSYPFTFETLLEDAKRRASAPYAPQRSSLPHLEIPTCIT